MATDRPLQKESRISAAAPVTEGRRPRALLPGFAARQLAVSLIEGVLVRGHTLDDVLASAAAKTKIKELEPRDRALARLIAATVLRRLGELDAVLGAFIEKPLPERTGRLRSILLSGAAQILFLETPAHAAISLSVEQCRRDANAKWFDRLANAVLRRVAKEGSRVLDGLDGVRLNIPPWLFDRWRDAYGEDSAQAIATASLVEAPLDVTVKSDAALWAERLGGTVLATGSVRFAARGRIDELLGYAEGAWWVQDAAVALPVRFLGDVRGLDIADLCAAPGGKTAQLASAGAKVTAVDISETRLARLKDNLARLQLHAEVIAADVTQWAPGRLFDAVLLDAPCTATGTIRRHPDILRLKRENDVRVLAELQMRLIENATRLIKLGGTLIYCSCSLEPEECVEQIDGFLARHTEFTRQPVTAAEVGGMTQWITSDGDLRTLPGVLALASSELSGVDGFFAARLKRQATKGNVATRSQPLS